MYFFSSPRLATSNHSIHRTAPMADVSTIEYNKQPKKRGNNVEPALHSFKGGGGGRSLMQTLTSSNPNPDLTP